MTDQHKSLTANVAMHRLLLLQLYKQIFLLDPDMGSQLPSEMVHAIELSTDISLADISEKSATKISVQNALLEFFNDVNDLVESTRHQIEIIVPE